MEATIMSKRNRMSVATIDSPEFINITSMSNPRISKCEVKVLYVGENRNRSYITKEVATEMARTLPGCPIVGYYIENKEDFGDHGDQVIIDGEGVKFKNQYNGDALLLTPEKSIQIQNKLDSDIAMSFDECIGYPATYEYCKNSVERTLRWAKRGKDVFNNPNQSLFGIVQGGEYEDLRKHCVEELVKMDFDGYSIGGTSVGEDKKTQYKMVRYATSYLPKDKVRYLMGVGDPIDIVENVCNGIDIFDCVSPTRLARHGHALTRFGKINIKNAKYKEDFTPIEDACTCYACQNYTKAYIKHLINCEETFGARLLSIHNIHYLINLTEELRQAIKEDRLLEYREEFIKNYYGNSK